MLHTLNRFLRHTPWSPLLIGEGRVRKTTLLPRFRRRACEPCAPPLRRVLHRIPMPHFSSCLFCPSSYHQHHRQLGRFGKSQASSRIIHPARHHPWHAHHFLLSRRLFSILSYL